MRRFRPNESETRRRSRCCGYIINLAAKAFLFGNDYNAFINDIERTEQAIAKDEQYLATEQARWRSKGPIGKFHNIVAYIRATSQRRQEFKQAVQMTIEQAQARGKTYLTYLLL